MTDFTILSDRASEYAITSNTADYAARIATDYAAVTARDAHRADPINRAATIRTARVAAIRAADAVYDAAITYSIYYAADAASARAASYEHIYAMYGNDLNEPNR